MVCSIARRAENLRVTHAASPGLIDSRVKQPPNTLYKRLTMFPHLRVGPWVNDPGSQLFQHV
jgi:hypothetical protein